METERAEVPPKHQRSPVAFFSYTWDPKSNRDWVEALATRLCSAEVNVIFDGWEVKPGDQLPHFMEKGVRESDFVLCICTPGYKQRFDNRVGGAGYEAHLMSAEALTKGNERKFIGLLREGEPSESLPSWLSGKMFIDFRGDPYSEESYEQLVAALHEILPQAPPVRSVGFWSSDLLAPTSVARQESYTEFFNASLKVVQHAKSKMMLLLKNNEATRHLMPRIESELELEHNRMNKLALTFGLQSSDEVKQSAGELAMFANLARLFSHHPDYEEKLEEVAANFTKAIPKFKDATRAEGGLR